MGQLRPGANRGIFRHLQRCHRILLLAAQPQSASAGYQEGHVRGTEHDRVHQRCRRREVLEGVEDDEDALARELLAKIEERCKVSA